MYHCKWRLHTPPYPHPPPPSQHNRNGSMVHQLLSAFVPLTPRLWQHWVYSFKWAFAHSLRITTTASVLPGLLSNWTAKRSLKKTSSSVLKNKLVWFLNCCVELSEISACLCVLRIQKKRVPDAEEGWNKSIHEERKMKCVSVRVWACVWVHGGSFNVEICVSKLRQSGPNAGKRSLAAGFRENRRRVNRLSLRNSP